VSPIRIGINAALLLFIFTIQETVISRIHLPVTGFSLYLAALVLMVILENRTGAVILGFVGGLVLDLSPSSQSPFGQWALILTAISYIIAVSVESVDEIISRPVGLGLFVALGASLALIAYLIMDSLLGQPTGTLGRDVIVIAGNLFWTMLIAPFLKPIFVAFRDATIGSRERI
jgi:cell shape-determining protein MreD